MLRKLHEKLFQEWVARGRGEQTIGKAKIGRPGEHKLVAA